MGTGKLYAVGLGDTNNRMAAPGTATAVALGRAC
jgi:hypothetical protein